MTRAVVDCPLTFHFKPAAPTDEEWDRSPWTRTESQFIPSEGRQSEILDHTIEIKDDYSVSRTLVAQADTNMLLRKAHFSRS